jgi:hypothetical protein
MVLPGKGYLHLAKGDSLMLIAVQLVINKKLEGEKYAD